MWTSTSDPTEDTAVFSYLDGLTNASTISPISQTAQDFGSFDHSNYAQANLNENQATWSSGLNANGRSINDPTLASEFDTDESFSNGYTSSTLYNYEACPVNDAPSISTETFTDDANKLYSQSTVEPSGSGPIIPWTPDNLATISKNPPPVEVGIAAGDCDCINCTIELHFQEAAALKVPFGSTSHCFKYPCHLQICKFETISHQYWAKGEWKRHYCSHFKQDGKYTCDDGDCKRAFSRSVDFFRHSNDVHCKCAQKFPCDVFGCKYGGDNGFRRKDKLTSHKRNVHDGKATVASGRLPRSIKPKPRVQDVGAGESAQRLG